MRKKRYDKT